MKKKLISLCIILLMIIPIQAQEPNTWQGPMAHPNSEAARQYQHKLRQQRLREMNDPTDDFLKLCRQRETGTTHSQIENMIIRYPNQIKARINNKDDRGVTAIWLLAYNGYAVMDRLPALGADVNVKDSKGWTVLMVAARARLSLLSLLNAGAKVNERNQDGATALLIAAGYGNTQGVCELVAKHADPSIADNDGMVPLMAAITSGVIETIRYAAGNTTARLGFVKNRFGLTALHIAVRTGKPLIVLEVMNQVGGSSSTDPSGRTPMQVAIHEGYNNIILVLKGRCRNYGGELRCS